MDIRWKYTLGRLFLWVVAEIVLSILGMDDLADYSEFLLETNPPILVVQEFTVK